MYVLKKHQHTYEDQIWKFKTASLNFQNLVFIIMLVVINVTSKNKFLTALLGHLHIFESHDVN